VRIENSNGRNNIRLSQLYNAAKQYFTGGAKTFLFRRLIPQETTPTFTIFTNIRGSNGPFTSHASIHESG
jgi:hypothetical protein